MTEKELIKRARYLAQRFEDYKSREELRAILHQIVVRNKKDHHEIWKLKENH